MTDRELAADVAPDPAPLRGLDELRASIDQLNGAIASARRGVANEVLIRIHDRAADGMTDEWKVGTQASDWVIASPSAVLAAAYADDSTVDAALKDLVGAELARAEVTDRLALVLVFRDGRWLEIQGIVSDDDASSDDPPYWEVFSPDGELVSAGPGPLWLLSDAAEPPPTERGVQEASDEALLEMLRDVTAELHRRGVVRHSHGPAMAELAEQLVWKQFGGFRGSYRDAGWDVLTDTGERIQVKAVQRRNDRRGGSRLLVPPPALFDSLVVVFFDDNLRVDEAWRVPAEVIEQVVGDDPGGRRRVNAAALLKDARSERITFKP